MRNSGYTLGALVLILGCSLLALAPVAIYYFIQRDPALVSVFVVLMFMFCIGAGCAALAGLYRMAIGRPVAAEPHRPELPAPAGYTVRRVPHVASKLPKVADHDVYAFRLADGRDVKVSRTAFEVFTDLGVPEREAFKAAGGGGSNSFRDMRDIALSLGFMRGNAWATPSAADDLRAYARENSL